MLHLILELLLDLKARVLIGRIISHLQYWGFQLKNYIYKYILGFDGQINKKMIPNCELMYIYCNSFPPNCLIITYFFF